MLIITNAGCFLEVVVHRYGKQPYDNSMYVCASYLAVFLLNAGAVRAASLRCVVFVALTFKSTSRPLFPPLSSVWSVVIQCSNPGPSFTVQLLGFFKHQRAENDAVTKVGEEFLHKLSAATTRREHICTRPPECGETPTAPATVGLFWAPHRGAHLLSTDLYAYEVSANCSYCRHEKKTLFNSKRPRSVLLGRRSLFNKVFKHLHPEERYPNIP